MNIEEVVPYKGYMIHIHQREELNDWEWIVRVRVDPMPLSGCEIRRDDALEQAKEIIDRLNGGTK